MYLILFEQGRMGYYDSSWTMMQMLQNYHLPEVVNMDNAEQVHAWYVARLETEAYHLPTVTEAQILALQGIASPNCSLEQFEDLTMAFESPPGSSAPPTFILETSNLDIVPATVGVARLANGERRYYIPPVKAHGSAHMYEVVPSLETILEVAGSPPQGEYNVSSFFAPTPETAKMCCYVSPAASAELGEMPPF